MPRVIAYDVVVGEDLNSLCRRVMAFVKLGWQPLGQPTITQSTEVILTKKGKRIKSKAVTTSLYYQAIVKYAEIAG